MVNLSDKPLAVVNTPELTLDRASIGSGDLRQNALRDLRQSSPSDNCLNSSNPTLVASASIEQIRGADFDNFVSQLTRNMGHGGDIKLQASVAVDLATPQNVDEGGVRDWLTRPTTEAYEYSGFVNDIDPGNRAATDLVRRLSTQTGPLGIDDLYRQAVASVKSVYGNEDPTTAAVVLTNVLKRACAEYRGQGIGDQGYASIANKIQDYRGGGAPTGDSLDIYYHSAALAVIYKGAGSGMAGLAAFMENQDTTFADDRVEADAQMDLARKMGIRGAFSGLLPF